MPLTRAWLRGLSGASGAAVLVPGGVFAALLLLALAGSFGRLGGLGQAFSGPAAPGSAQVANALAAPRSHGPALLPVVASPARTGLRAAVRSGASPGLSPGAGGGHSSTRGGPAPRPGSPGASTPSGNPGAPPSAGAPGGCASCPQPPPHQTLIDQVVAAGASVTSKLPGPVGQVTTQLLKQVGATVDKILSSSSATGALAPPGSTLG
jgi:hypothetical protein